MRTTIPLPILIALMGIALSPDLQAQGSVFTYQGRLSDINGALNTNVPMVFRLYQAPSSGGPLWEETHPSVAVTNGLFVVSLGQTVPVNATIFNGNARWLGISVNGGVELTPRTPTTAAPYAIAAGHLTGVVPAGGLSGPYSSPVTFNNPGNAFNGSGAGLTGLNASQLTSGTVPVGALGNAWRISGNAGTTPGTHFVGTSDNQPLELRANNQRAFRLEPTPRSDTVNVVGGSSHNRAEAGAVGATIGGGGSGNYSGEAWTNSVMEDFGTIGGGLGNRIYVNSFAGTIAGGSANSLLRSSGSSAIGGGRSNSVGGYYAVITGGFDNQIETNAWYSTISGGGFNRIGTNAWVSSIGGGAAISIGTNSDYCVIGGGLENEIGYHSDWSAIVGGLDNTIEFTTSNSFIGGGRKNMIQRAATYSAIGGGHLNRIGTNSDASVISGGEENNVWTNSQYCAIGGGSRNGTGPNSYNAVIAGGSWNYIGTNSIGGVIGGGDNNSIGANTLNATIPGGGFNTAEGEYSFATGRDSTAAGDYSFALGRRAFAGGPGTFVWADSQNEDFAIGNADSVNFRCRGGVRFSSGNAGSGQTVAWLPGGTAWGFSSDRNLKEGLTKVNAQEVLDKVSRLPMNEWNFKGHSQRHIGPMAQDFHALFPLNENDKMIDSGDLHGVALAAIQGLNQKVEGQRSELKLKETEITELKLALAELRNQMNVMRQQLDGGTR